MENFAFHAPTQVFFGREQITTLGNTLKTLGATRLLLTYGGGSIKRNGIYEAVVTELNDSGVAFVEQSGIEPNPRTSTVRKGIEICREHDVDFILAVGGGSIVDATKAIAAGAVYDGDVLDLLNYEVTPGNALPLGVVVTFPGAGSETDHGCIITADDDPDNKKLTLVNPVLYPKFAILDPEYTFSVPARMTAAGCVDMFSHLLEQYLPLDDGTYVQDRMNEAMMRTVVEFAPRVVSHPDDYIARANIMWTGSLQTMGFILATGKKQLGDFTTHHIANELSSMYDMAHGIAIALILPRWMKYVVEQGAPPEKFAQYARDIWGVSESVDLKAARLGIQNTEQFFSQMGMPSRLRDEGVDESRLMELAVKATSEGPLGSIYTVNKEDAYQILRSAY